MAGIVHNTIADNFVWHNGFPEPGAGAGVGIFSAGPGGVVSGNVIAKNTLVNNGLPGIAFHSHDPFDNLNDNLLVANRIFGNGADTDDALTSGTTGINVFGASPITGTLIVENVITGQDDDIVVKTTGHAEAHLNSLLGKENRAREHQRHWGRCWHSERHRELVGLPCGSGWTKLLDRKRDQHSFHAMARKAVRRP